MDRELIIEQLKAFLRIPSISTDPAYAGDVRRAAEFVRDLLREAGLGNARLIEGNGHPLVYADWLEAPGKPTLLLYGHYDVQPADPIELWKSPPFEPEIRGDDIFARGAVDDKGQVMILVCAIRTLMERDGRLPVNVKVLIEGEEESGGGHIESYVQSHADELKADAAVICDTEMFAPGLPTLCIGLRGIVYGEIVVNGADRDLHSGVYGGAAPNAIQGAAEIVAALKGRDGRINIPGFYDRVAPPTSAEREAWARLPFDEERYRMDEVGASALTGEAGLSVIERTWVRPTLEVHGIRGGFIGEGAKTVIPATAVVKISARLVPDQRPDEAAEQIARAVAAACPAGISASFRMIHGAGPSMVNPEHPLILAAARVMTEVFSRETVYIRSGGSIPIVGLFQRALGLPSVMMGFGLPDDNLHAPNEKFHLPNLFAGIDSVVRYITVV